MGALFNRQFALNLGGVGIATSLVDPTQAHSTLRIAFKVERTLQPEPNTAELSIWNLSPDSRALLSQGKDLPTTLEVGYAASTFQIFSGDLVYAASQRQGTDWVTRLQAKDGGKKYASARVNESFAAGTLLKTAVEATAKALAVPLGNLAEQLSKGNIRGAKETLSKGAVVSGQASKNLDRLLKGAGFEWSIQDGQLQVLEPGVVLPGDAVALNADSGLIGSPEVGDKGLVKARSLLQPGLSPGRPLLLDSVAGSKPIAGSFRIERVAYVGDTWGADWYADMELSAI